MNEVEVVRFKIDGVLIPTPSETNITYEDLDSEDSTRNLITGVLERSVIRYGVMKIDLIFLLQDKPNIATILNAVKPKHIVVEAYDWQNQLIETKKMYATSRKLGVVWSNGKYKGKGLQFSLIER